MPSPVLAENLKITLHDVSKKFGTQRLFHHVNASFHSGQKYAITGANGSGKSTLLKIIAGIVTPSSGRAEWQIEDKTMATEDYYRFLSLAAPYSELPEELSLTEVFNFQNSLSPVGISAADLATELELNAEKEIRNYSSGMKQRLKLGLAFAANRPVLLLDEPTTNLDDRWCRWYIRKIEALHPEQLVIVCSNSPAEYQFCNHTLSVSAFTEKR